MSSAHRFRMSSEDNSGSTATAAAAVAAAATGGAEGDAANRSIVVDAAFFEEQFLRCSVCQESFNEMKRPPKSLPCNHTFCVPCLTQIFNHAQPQSRRNLLWADEALDGPLKCPTCRVEIFVSKNKIKDLPNDHRVVQMIDFLSQVIFELSGSCRFSSSPKIKGLQKKGKKKYISFINRKRTFSLVLKLVFAIKLAKNHFSSRTVH